METSPSENTCPHCGDTRLNIYFAEHSGDQLGVLSDHFSRRHPAGTGGGRHAFSGEELRVLAEACEMTAKTGDRFYEAEL